MPKAGPGRSDGSGTYLTAAVYPAPPLPPSSPSPPSLRVLPTDQAQPPPSPSGGPTRLITNKAAASAVSPAGGSCTTGRGAIRCDDRQGRCAGRQGPSAGPPGHCAGRPCRHGRCVAIGAKAAVPGPKAVAIAAKAAVPAAKAAQPAMGPAWTWWNPTRSSLVSAPMAIVIGKATPCLSIPTTSVMPVRARFTPPVSILQLRASLAQ